ncbi:SDR family NAD(P)-dependent oxidoreductase [Leptolyngbya sp. FACHB-261]|uniref:SDR family NAD(P)-dependent oxidoreductase n=1 Tax=Leptolyngbya sp. FACHB-261 TaxID=2692806 RepID=UPI001681FAA0|nr:SDR family oxidoreductase [Leptolyngbya sp. FACHB-261]MBD2103874.1 SDR family oxidoreductase [Leptolyngbya sp. FACHB-261]
MSKQQKPSKQTGHNKSELTKPITRREIIGASVAGLAAAATANSAFANTQKPVESENSRVNSTGKFRDKVVLITGATSGIGKATAYAFAREGAKVFFCGRRTELGETNVREIKAFGGEATYMQADVRKEGEVRNFVNGCVQKYGRIDIAFNNAGIEAPPKAIADLSLEEWNNVIATNVTGVFLAMKYEIPVMSKQASGIIVNTASVGGHQGFANIGPYGASKAGVMSLSRTGAMELTSKNIRVNSFSPGAVDTPMLHRALSSWGMSTEAAVKDYPINRLATAEEMARVVMWLSSEDATIMVGTDIDATGGYITK